MSFKDIKIPGEIIEVEGDKKTNEIFLLALSTCHWCMKGKAWLNENKYHYKFVDVDKIETEERINFKREVSKLFNTMVRYPFIIINGKKFYAGYNPDEWKEMLIE